MTSVRLIHPQEHHKVPIALATSKCTLFSTNPDLTSTPYEIQSSVSVDAFRQFVQELRHGSGDLTSDALPDLTELAQEFGFQELRTKIRISALEFKFGGEVSRLSADVQRLTKDVTALRSSAPSAKGPIGKLEEDVEKLQLRVHKQKGKLTDALAKLPSQSFSSDLEDLRSDVSKLKEQLAKPAPAPEYAPDKLANQVKILRSELSALRTEIGRSAESSALARSLARSLTLEKLPADRSSLKAHVQEQVASEISDVRRELSEVKGRVTVNQKDLDILKLQIAGLAPGTIPKAPSFTGAVGDAEKPLLESEIIAGNPEIFAEFRGRQFGLLWRGGRDGFAAKEFHRRCDGRANTLTVIKDSDGNVFGGFTTVAWEKGDLKRSRGGGAGGEEGLKSFLFTLKNPNDLGARKFGLKSKRSPPIQYVATTGPDFVDVGVASQSNAMSDSTVHLGSSYRNDTGLDGEIVFTGSAFFRVQEIEVFELED